jgi:branched-chain amino acid transport system ATP-binding protein
LLEIKDLTVYYGKAVALDKINIKIGDGELVSVLGPNGAGKTTLLRAISGLVKHPGFEAFWLLKGSMIGTITFDGERIDNLMPHKIVKRGVIHCPERRRLYPQLTVLENLKMGAFPRKDKGKIKEDLEKVLDLFPVLKEREKQMAGTLSGGQQQMVAIGRALMSNPKLLMLDEPSLGLAPMLKDAIFNTVNEIRKRGITVLLVEQDVSEALNILDRAYVLEHGQIAMEGSREELMKDPRVREIYLGIT